MQGGELASAQPIVVLAERAISLQGSGWYVCQQGGAMAPLCALQEAYSVFRRPCTVLIGCDRCQLRCVLLCWSLC